MSGPGQWNKSLQGGVVDWEVKKLDSKNQQLKLPNGQTMCWKVRSHRDKLETALLKCSHIIIEPQEQLNLKKPWYISELRIFIWDKLGLWQTWLSKPTLNAMGLMKKLEKVFSYGIPMKHDHDQSRVWNSSKKSQEGPQSDSYGCSQVSFVRNGKGTFRWDNVFLLEHVWCGWTLLYYRVSCHVSWEGFYHIVKDPGKVMDPKHNPNGQCMESKPCLRLKLIKVVFHYVDHLYGSGNNKVTVEILYSYIKNTIT